MTYLTRRTLARRPPRKRRGLGGFIDDIEATLGQPSANQQCVDQANAMVAPADAKIDDLIKNWDPTGFYTPDDINQLVSQTMSVVQQAGNAIAEAMTDPNTSSAQDALVSANDDLGRAGRRSLAYLQAGRDAAAQGVRVVNAPGFKRWVTDTLAAASAGMVAVSTVGCVRPWWIGAVALFQGAFDAAYGVARAFVGAVIAIGETALKVVGDLPEIYDIVKWAAVAGGAYWLWLEIRKRQKVGQSIL